MKSTQVAILGDNKVTNLLHQKKKPAGLSIWLGRPGKVAEADVHMRDAVRRGVPFRKVVVALGTYDLIRMDEEKNPIEVLTNWDPIAIADHWVRTLGKWKNTDGTRPAFLWNLPDAPVSEEVSMDVARNFAARVDILRARMLRAAEDEGITLQVFSFPDLPGIGDLSPGDFNKGYLPLRDGRIARAWVKRVEAFLGVSWFANAPVLCPKKSEWLAKAIYKILADDKLPPLEKEIAQQETIEQFAKMVGLAPKRAYVPTPLDVLPTTPPLKKKRRHLTFASVEDSEDLTLEEEERLLAPSFRIETPGKFLEALGSA